MRVTHALTNALKLFVLDLAVVEGIQFAAEFFGLVSGLGRVQSAVHGHVHNLVLDAQEFVVLEVGTGIVVIGIKEN